MVTAKSYKTYVSFDPESEIDAAKGSYPPALIIHGAINTLHMPAESIRLFNAYPGEKGDSALIVDGMEHGQQMVADSPVFQSWIAKVDERVRSLL